MRVLAGLIALAAITISPAAFAGASAVDPFFLAPVTSTFINAAGRTPVALSSVIGAGTAVIIVEGQSNAQNTAPTPYTPVNSGAIFSFNIYDGGLYAAQDPQLGTTGFGPSPGGTYVGCMCFRLADKLISAGKFSKVILVPIAVGGTKFAYWAPGSDDPTTGLPNLNHRIIATAKRLAAAGLSCTAIINDQGESDASMNTLAAQVTADIDAIVQTWRDHGAACRFFQSLTSYTAGATNAATRLGETNAVDHTGLRIWQGPDTDTLGPSDRQDGTHWNDAGSDAVASLWSTVLQADLP